MKIILSLLLLSMSLVFVSCNDKDQDYSLAFERTVTSDTLSVTVDNSVTCHFNVSAKPGVYSDNITVKVYKKDLLMSPDYITASIVPFMGLQESVGVTAVITALDTCPPGMYTVIITGTNTRVSKTITYILDVI